MGQLDYRLTHWYNNTLLILRRRRAIVASDGTSPFGVALRADRAVGTYYRVRALTAHRRFSRRRVRSGQLLFGFPHPPRIREDPLPGNDYPWYTVCDFGIGQLTYQLIAAPGSERTRHEPLWISITTPLRVEHRIQKERLRASVACVIFPHSSLFSQNLLRANASCSTRSRPYSL